MKQKEFYKGIDEIINHSIDKKRAISYESALKTMHFVNKYDTMKRGQKPIYSKSLNKYYIK